jgi:hypothetical protein
LASLVHAVVENAREAAEIRGLEIECDGFDDTQNVLANPQCCSVIVEALLGWTIRDAKDHSQVVIESTTNADTITVTIQNSHLIEYLRTSDSQHGLTSIVTEEIFDFKRWVTAWGGKLEVSQIIGIGIHATLCLKTHAWGIAHMDSEVQSAH